MALSRGRSPFAYERELGWLAVLLLTVGVVLVQLASSPKGGKRRAAAPDESALLGCGAVFIACLTSAGAGLYLEAIVKFTRPSVWVRNMQMAGFGLVLGLAMAWGKDGEKIQEKGFLVGFNGLVYAVVFLQAPREMRAHSFGGLLTAVVVKHADNVIKGFATGLAIIVSCLFSAALFGFIITFQYCIGAFVVVTSVFLYSLHMHVERWVAQSGGKVTPCRIAAVAAAACLCATL
eukprot:gene36963-1391_t